MTLTKIPWKYDECDIVILYDFGPFVVDEILYRYNTMNDDHNAQWVFSLKEDSTFTDYEPAYHGAVWSLLMKHELTPAHERVWKDYWCLNHGEDS